MPRYKWNETLPCANCGGLTPDVAIGQMSFQCCRCMEWNVVGVLGKTTVVMFTSFHTGDKTTDDSAPRGGSA